MSHTIPFKFAIGDYTLYPAINEGKIWIQHISGEGGEFPEEDFVKAIEDFYAKHF